MEPRYALPCAKHGFVESLRGNFVECKTVTHPRAVCRGVAIATARDRITPSPFSNRKQVAMASRIMNRRELRKQSDQAEQIASADGTSEAPPTTKKRKPKAGTV